MRDTSLAGTCPERAYVVVPSVHVSPARLALARRHHTVEAACAAMGEGLVLEADGARVVAFHERHLRFVEHAVTTGRLTV